MFSERKAVWLQSVQQIKEGDIFEGKVNRVTDFGAFVDLCFSDGEHLHRCFCLLCPFYGLLLMVFCLMLDGVLIWQKACPLLHKAKAFFTNLFYSILLSHRLLVAFDGCPCHMTYFPHQIINVPCRVHHCRIWAVSFLLH